MVGYITESFDGSSILQLVEATQTNNSNKSKKQDSSSTSSLCSRYNAMKNVIDLRIRPCHRLKSNICDIDECKAMMADQILAMRLRESQAYACSDYLQLEEKMSIPRQTYVFLPKSMTRIILLDSETRAFHEPIDPSAREQMALWVYRIVDHFGLPREFGYIAMSYVDRFLCVYDCDKNIFKLSCVAAIYTTTKIHGVAREMILPSCLSQLSHGDFTVEDVTTMERLIMHTIKWNMNPPTAYSYLNICEAFFARETSHHIRDAMLNVACFLTELGTCDYFLVRYKQSQVAAAALLLIASMTSKDVFSSEERSHLYEAVFHLLGVRRHSQSTKFLVSRLTQLYKRSEQFQLFDQSCMEVKSFVDGKHTKERLETSSAFTSPACISVLGSTALRERYYQD